MKKNAEIRILCTAPYMTETAFFIRIKKLPEECIVYSGRVFSNRTFTFKAEHCCYQVEIRNNAGLSPLGIVKWVDLRKRNCIGISAIYHGNPAATPEPTVTVDFTAVDANYPGITPIDGGITVWQNTP